jgi:hypothetical protein
MAIALLVFSLAASYVGLRAFGRGRGKIDTEQAG